MSKSPLNQVIQSLRRIAGEKAGTIADGELLERFVTKRDEAAFELLVRRHGKMVFGVCRRVLRDEHDAEDAFQASFLIMARRVSSISNRSSLGGWLYKVAYRVALEAKSRKSSLAKRECSWQDVTVAATTHEPGSVTEQRELRLLIESEVSRLPEKYRLPFVLCHFESKSNREAARELGCPLGTVESRLTRARAKLRSRLARRGVAPSIVMLAGGLTKDQASLPGLLVLDTVKVATKVATGQAAAAMSANAAALAETVLKSMWITRVSVIGLGVAVTLIVSAAGLFLNRSEAEPPPGATSAAPNPAPVAVRTTQENALGAAPHQKFESAPGYAWVIVPREGRGTPWAVGWMPSPLPGFPDGAGISAFEETAKDGGLMIFLAYPPGSNCRPVAYDADHKRYVFKIEGAVGTSTAGLARFHLNPKILPADQVKQVGIEGLTPEGPKVISRLAAARAKDAGVEVPGFPQVGEPYDFSLTAMDGKKISAADLRGKVVILDFWATWCSPCMELLPEIKKLYEKHHADGLEVVGINFDNNPEKAKSSCRSLGLEWPQVLVPADEERRTLWQEATGLGALPCVLLIDREGILRAEQPAHLEQEIAKLIRKIEKSK